MDVLYITGKRSQEGQIILSGILLSEEDARRKKALRHDMDITAKMTRAEFSELFTLPNEDNDKYVANQMANRLRPLKKKYNSILGAVMTIPVADSRFRVDEFYHLSDLKR
jgi:hypothetical protein